MNIGKVVRELGVSGDFGPKKSHMKNQQNLQLFKTIPSVHAYLSMPNSSDIPIIYIA